MELDTNFEDIEFLDDEQRIQESLEIATELETQEPVFYEEESLTLHNALFDKDSKKLIFERVNLKGKKVQGKTLSEFNLREVLPSRLTRIHKATGDSLEVLVDEMESENSMFNERVKELEYDLIPPPIFARLIATIQPKKSFDRTPESSSNLKGTSSLLVAVRSCVGKNIKKMMSLLLEAWDLMNRFVSLGSKITNLREYLQVNLENDEFFYKDVVTTFVLKVSGMTKLKRKEDDLPSLIRIK
jgi:hypothetical protein